jgi:predicted ribosomally synthesized peptide with SipW-like signal peptide
MINQKIAMSAISILSALALTGGASLAAFTDQATSTGNSFITGNAHLQISNDSVSALGGTPTGFGDSIAGPSFSGMFPGILGHNIFGLETTAQRPSILRRQLMLRIFLHRLAC